MTESRPADASHRAIRCCILASVDDGGPERLSARSPRSDRSRYRASRLFGLIPKAGHAFRVQVIALSLLLAVSLSACQQPAGRIFQTTLPTDGYDPMAVTLSDETGLVTAIEPAARDQVTWSDRQPAVQQDPITPNASILTWLGTLCDRDATLWFRTTQEGYDLHLTVNVKGGFPGGCPGVAVLRALRIVTSSPIPVDSIVLTGV